MNQLSNSYANAKRLLILTSTYGDGDAPASANQFLHKLESMPASMILPWTVLGFGDRQFCSFCAFADAVSTTLQQRNWPQLLPTDYVDRQSGPSFERWGEKLGKAINIPLKLNYSPLRRPTQSLVLFERKDYGLAINTHTCVLQFKPTSGKSLPRFAAGDLVGILPPDCNAPRFYSLASSSKDGVLEICVRRQERGLCSSYLYNMEVGECANVFIQKNPQFKPSKNKHPIILIGAGTGIGPLIGFIRANKKQRPIYLYWGGRLAESDFLYQDELKSCLSDKRLLQLHVAFSRGPEPIYVQDKLLENAVQIRELVTDNAQIMLCGGRRMASDVNTTMNIILAPLSLDVEGLKELNLYLEDTY